MWVVMFTGLPASGKSTIRQKLVEALMQHIQSTAYDLHSPNNEHELAALRYCQNFRMVQASSDDVLDMIAAQQRLTYSAAFDIYKDLANTAFWHRLHLAVATRTPVIIVDRTFVNEKSRKDVITTVQQQQAIAVANYKFMVIEVLTPEAGEWTNRLKSRPGKMIPPEVLEDMAKRQTSPRGDAFKYDSFLSIDGPGVVDDAVFLAKRTIMKSVPEFSIAA